MSDLFGASALQIAEAVRTGEASAPDVVRAHLERIAQLDGKVGAFQLVRAERALEEADALQRRDDLTTLPLAGVPVAIKDNVAVAGEPLRNGSLATSPVPSAADHELVMRLRAAGAIVVGKTRVPELCVWGWTDGAFGTARNPWNLDRTPGGSSGGSAAAVAAGMVPLAQGSDGGGSIRIPAAVCGLVGIKPGSGVVPGSPQSSGWCGLSSNGPLATTVDDTALGLAVMAARPELAAVHPPGRLRIAISLRSPMNGITLDSEYQAATRRTGDLLVAAGHDVVGAEPSYGWAPYVAGIRAVVGIAEEAAGLSVGALERRTRPMVRAGKVAAKLRLMRERDRERWLTRASDFFADIDLLVTPTIASLPPVAEGWWQKSWLANARAGTFAPFTNPWNLAAYPAASVPAGIHSAGVPLAVQLVAPPGFEARVLSVAKQLEQLRPWPRHAPSGVVADGSVQQR